MKHLTGLDAADMVALETLIDRYNLRRIVSALATLAHEKSEHVQSAWQDQPLARAWTRAAQKLEMAADSPAVVGVP